MAAPQVRELQSLIDQYSTAFNPQRELINQDLSTIDQSGVAQEQGLKAKQTEAFGQINQDASNKGVFFSGFSPDQQAKYTAGTYLPELAKLQATIAAGRSSLLGKKAELDSSARTSAINAQEGDRSQLTAWQQAEADRAFQAEQNRLKIAADERQAAASRSVAADKKPTTAQALVGLFSGYKPAYEGGEAYYTEREVIPTLMADYGLSKADASNLAYQYRKNTFGEGAGR